jgi:CRP-like cAMP-binding protein
LFKNQTLKLTEALLEINHQLPNELVCERGIEIDVCTLIFRGKVTVFAGSDNFRSEVSSWTLVAPGIFSQTAFTPDFSAFVTSGPCRCLRLYKKRFIDDVDASAVECTVRDRQIASSMNHEYFPSDQTEQE